MLTRSSSEAVRYSPEQEVDGEPRELMARLHDRRQRYAREAGHADVVEADDGDVAGHGQPDLLHRLEEIDGEEVVGREERGRRILQLEERPHGGPQPVVTAEVRRVAEPDDEPRISGGASSVQCARIAG